MNVHRLTTLSLLSSSLTLLPLHVDAASTHQTKRTVPYTAQELNPADGHLPQGAAAPAIVSSQAYVKSLAKIVYYWAYPMVNLFARTNQWEVMKKPGLYLGMFPAAPENRISYQTNLLLPSQRWIVSPTMDTIYGSSFLNLKKEAVVLQIPMQIPSQFYWSIQISDAFTNVIHQFGSNREAQGGKYLVVSPDWEGELPKEFKGVLKMPTNFAWILSSSYMGSSPQSQQDARELLSQIDVYPLSQNNGDFRVVDLEAINKNIVFPEGATEEIVKENPERFRPYWMNPHDFWANLSKALELNTTASKEEMPMIEQAKSLIALYQHDHVYKILLDQAALEAYTELKTGSKYQFLGVDAGNGWQRQENAGCWGSDWYGRAQASAVNLLGSNSKDVLTFTRATDADHYPLDGRYTYVLNFTKDSLPPVNQNKGGFWSLTLYNEDYFMLPNPPNGRNRIGTVDINADDLQFNSDGSFSITISQLEPQNISARANWLPSPPGKFNLVFRLYAPSESVLKREYKLPNVTRKF